MTMFDGDRAGWARYTGSRRTLALLAAKPENPEDPEARP